MTRICVLISLGVLCLPASLRAAGGNHVEYSRDIKPILSENCYACHGPDEAKRKARLRLDTREGALAELRGGRHAIVPGRPADGTLIERINADDEMDVMPPLQTGKKLTAGQKELLRRWIEEGANFDAHWSYVAPKRPAVPAVKDASWPVNDIDRFICARLEEEGLSPSGPADRRTLLRRLSLDLTGLPPTPEQVRAFEQDPSPDAYAKQVERLLASPHYGERMANYWLDLVRYGDSKGYHSDNPINVWPYRDYVIAAFNDNKPFDVFTTEQLAGDLLPDARDEQKIASGYNRLNLHTEEGGAQPKEYLAKYFADRVRNTSSVWLAATMGCAECHDHKYDPITTRDFYRFGAFFADVSEVAVGVQPPNLRLPTGAQTAELQRIERQLGPLERRYSADTPELEAAYAAWEREISAAPGITWRPLTPLFRSSSAGGAVVLQPHDTLIVNGDPIDKDRYVLGFHTDQKYVTGIRLEALTSTALPQRGPGRAANGNFVLSEFELHIAPAFEPGRNRRVRLQNASADFSQKDFPVAAAIDGKRETGWAILPEVSKPHTAVFEAAEPFGFEGGTVIVATMDQSFGGDHLIGHFRLSVTSDPNPARANGPGDLPKEIRQILAVEAGKRTAEQKTALRSHFRSITPLLKPTRDRIAQLKARRDEVERGVVTMLVSQSVKPREIRVLPRGNWMDDSGEVVQPDVPGFLLPISSRTARVALADQGAGVAPAQPAAIPVAAASDAGASPADTAATGGGRYSRLDLARWMTSPENPLVARVMVNRLWYLLFGQGIVRTLEDFGSQGAWPTHPELPDWLAVEFVESGWDVNRIVRLIVMSRTYQQSSKPSPDQLQRDPANQLLARQNRFRLDAEFIRDAALQASGLLSEKIGGPSVFPYQPAGFWSFLNFPLRDWYPSKDEDQYRRGLYTWRQRTLPHPSLIAFDASSREECMAERPRSNTPLQALVLLNDPTYVEAARVLAAKMLAETPGQDFAQRLAYIFGRALQREPRPQEVKILAELCGKHMKEYEQDRAAAEALLKVGYAPIPGGANVAELAAWTSVTRTVLNLHEVITRN